MILKEYYRDDLIERINNTDEAVFASVGWSRNAVLDTPDVMDQLWTCYQKDVEEYECDEEYAFADSLKLQIRDMAAGRIRKHSTRNTRMKMFCFQLVILGRNTFALLKRMVF